VRLVPADATPSTSFYPWIWIPLECNFTLHNN
jgi:hypothetical protein